MTKTNKIPTDWLRWCQSMQRKYGERFNSFLIEYSALGVLVVIEYSFKRVEFIFRKAYSERDNDIERQQMTEFIHKQLDER